MTKWRRSPLELVALVAIYAAGLGFALYQAEQSLKNHQIVNQEQIDWSKR